MKDDRLRSPFKDGYLLELGRALAIFATLEWNAVYCCNGIRPGFINTIRGNGKRRALTSGEIATKLVNFSKDMPPSEFKERIHAAALEFKRLTDDVRNNLVHGKPCTDRATGQASLSCYMTGIWSVERLSDAADDFSECSEKLNAFLYESHFFDKLRDPKFEPSTELVE